MMTWCHIEVLLTMTHHGGYVLYEIVFNAHGGYVLYEIVLKVCTASSRCCRNHYFNDQTVLTATKNHGRLHQATNNNNNSNRQLAAIILMQDEVYNGTLWMMSLTFKAY